MLQMFGFYQYCVNQTFHAKQTLKNVRMSRKELLMENPRRLPVMSTNPNCEDFNACFVGLFLK